MQIMKLIFDGTRPLRRDAPPLNDNAWELIQRCWAENASERPGMKDVAELMLKYMDIKGEDDALSGYHCLDDQFTFFRRNPSIENSTSWTEHED